MLTHTEEIRVISIRPTDVISIGGLHHTVKETSQSKVGTHRLTTLRLWEHLWHGETEITLVSELPITVIRPN